MCCSPMKFLNGSGVLNCFSRSATGFLKHKAAQKSTIMPYVKFLNYNVFKEIEH